MKKLLIEERLINAKLIPLIEHFVSASKCTDCFTSKGLVKNTCVVSGGQPRRVGSDYFEAQNKICFVLLNPSGAVTKKETVWEENMERLSSDEHESEQAWNDFQDFLAEDEKNWSNGKWPKLYYGATELLESEVSFVNAMLCADDDDSYPPAAIANCLLHQKKSLRAIQLLDPSMVVLSGQDVINAFLKEEQKTTLKELRQKRDSYYERWNDARKEDKLTLKHLENASFQKISKSYLKKEIIDALPSAEFFWMGHYAARNAESKRDADFFKYLLGIREALS